MEKLVQWTADQRQDGAAVDALMTQFMTRYGSSSAFVSINLFSLSQKESILSQLLAMLEYKNGDYKHWSDSVVLKCLQVVKILCREKQGSLCAISEKGISLLLQHAHVYNNEQTFQDTPVAIEALKCIANFLYHELSLKSVIVECGSGFRLVEALRNKTLSLDALFLIHRILFFLSVRNDAFTNQCMQDYDLHTALLQHMDPLVSRLTPDSVASMMPVNELTVIQEILKIIFNMTMAASPDIVFGAFLGMAGLGQSKDKLQELETEKKREEKNAKLKNFIPLISRILTVIKWQPQPLKPPHSLAMNALLNYPLYSEEWRSTVWFPNQDYALVDTLMDMFETSIMRAFPVGQSDVDSVHPDSVEGLSFDEAISPLLVLLCSLGRWDPTAQAKIKSRVAPKSMQVDYLMIYTSDRKKPLSKGDTLVARMIGFMTSALHSNLSRLCSELLFVCCNENGKSLLLHSCLAQELILYVGYGNAAGFLFNRGIMVSQPDATDVHQIDGVPINPITGQIEQGYRIETIQRKKPIQKTVSITNADGTTTEQVVQEYVQVEEKVRVREDGEIEEDPLLNMTEEEKEQEAMKLMHLIHDLNKTGIIKTVMKNE